MAGIDGSGLNLDPDCEMFIRGDPDFRSMTQLSKLGLPFGCCVLGWASVLISNVQSNRPLHTGSHRYGIATAIGLGVGLLANKWRYAYMAEKDFQYYHYMTLHPEDFQAKERVKFKNYIRPWVPWR